MDPLVTTARLTLRDWSEDDAPAAFAIYGSSDVARWLTPALDRITDVDAMRSVLSTWRRQRPELVPPQGRWAVERTADGVVVGSALVRPLLDGDTASALGLARAFRTAAAAG